MAQGRVLYRWLRPVRPITFDSGTCWSLGLVEQPGAPTCRFKEVCGADRNKAFAPPTNLPPDNPS